MSTHAKLSASKAHRWLNCPGSINASEGLENQKSSGAARTGTAAHFVGETCLRFKDIKLQDLLGCFVVMDGDDADSWCDKTSFKKLSKDKAKEDFIEIDQKMIDGVEVYLDAISNILEEIDDPSAELFAERYFDMSHIHPDFGGSADYLVVQAFGWAHLIDYKNGYTLVEVEDNEQLKKYGVGVINDFPDCEGVHTYIVQPNASHHDGPVRKASYSAAELEAFKLRLVEGAKETARPNAPFRSGSWCTFCPALHNCEEAQGHVLEQTKADFDDDPDDLDLPATEDKAYARRLGELKEWLPFIEGWCKAVAKAAQQTAEAGKEIPGFKLVKKSKNRAYKPEVDEKRVVARMRAAGAKKADCFKPATLKTPAQLEKAGTNKKVAKAIVAELVHKPEGDLTLVPLSDSRTACSLAGQAIDDFADEGDPLG